jgi:Tol biopolymer transport system component
MEFPRLSPDGSSLAFSQRTGDGKNLTVWDFARAVATRLTFEKVAVQAPVWSPDSRQLAYQIAGKGLYRKSISGANQPELLVQGASAVPLDWSHDGKFLIYRTNAATGRDIWAVPFIDGIKPEPFPVLAEPFQQDTARLSPDGKWLAYSSNESGSRELYIQSFLPPGSGGTVGKWQVSNTGGVNPVWRGDAKELYYSNPDGDIMVVGVHPQGTGLQLDGPKLLLKAGMDPAALHTFDATPDGQKFIVRLAPNGSATDVRYTVVTNWQSSLK